MSSNHNAVLGALAAQMLHVHGITGRLTGGFNRLKLSVAGALSATAGVAILDTMKQLIEKTKDYSHELAKIQNMGGEASKAVVSGQIEKKSFDIIQRVPMKVTDVMAVYGTAYSILGDEAAQKMMEPLARFQSVMEAQKDYHGNAKEDLSKFLRAGELGGRLTDPNTHKAAIAELEKFLDLSQKVMTATHGMVTPQTMLGLAQQSGFSMRGMSDEGFMNMAMVSQAMGGPRAGTALLSTYAQMGGGKMTAATAKNMQDMGMLKEDDWHTDHGKVIVNADAQKRLGALVSKNPMELVNEMLKNLEAQGVTDPVEQNRRVMGALGRQTSQRFVAEQMMNKTQLDEERARMGQGYGAAGSAGTFKDKSVETNLKALTNAWENLQYAVAGPNSPAIVSILQSLTSVLNSMTLVIRNMDPATLTAVGKGIALLGVALVAGGAIAILAAIGPAGWLIGGLAALGVALADPNLSGGFSTLVSNIYKQLADATREWRKSDSISEMVNGWYTQLADATRAWRKNNSISEAISEWFTSNVMDPLQKWFSSDSIAKAFEGFGSRIWNELKSQLGGIFSKKSLDPSTQEFNDALKKPMRFDPGSSTIKAQPIALSLNVDGRTLAQTMSQELEYLYEHATGAPSYDGSRRHIPADGGMMGT